jgi:hypothetical protein
MSATANQRGGNGSIAIERLTALLPGAVLLPISRREKAPRGFDAKDWQNTTFEETQRHHYQARLRQAENTGVLLGQPSGSLCAIDIDDDELIQGFLDLNPDFARTLCSKGQRGCQFWVIIEGDYPHQVAKLKHPDGRTYGEWRADGGQSVIRGVHPEGMHYQLLCDSPPVRIRFDQIRWPLALVLPWKNSPATNGKPGAPAGARNGLSDRVRAYLAKTDPAISGQDGHGTTFKVACALVWGFGLDPEQAFLFLSEYNAGCQPPWNEKELRHKLNEVLKVPSHEKPRGHLLEGNSGRSVSKTEGSAKGAVDESPKAQDAEPQSQPASNGEKPQLILPCPKFEINDSARQCFTVLAKTRRYFTRDRTVFEVVQDDDGDGLRLIELDPAAFRSQLESYFRLVTRRTLPDGTIVIIENRCSVDNAIALLKADPTFEILPRIKIVTAAAVFTEIDGKIEALNKGYHDVLGGILITREREIITLNLKEASASLLTLLDDFDFISEADRSRALASFISPALRLGGLLPADFPLDLSEANESQSGKTYRQKVDCALYGEEPFVLNKNEEGGVGSIDERASDGLISGKPFLMIENLRGPVRSQLVESALRGVGYVQARRAYSRSVQVRPTGFAGCSVPIRPKPRPILRTVLSSLEFVNKRSITVSKFSQKAISWPTSGPKAIITSHAF